MVLQKSQKMQHIRYDIRGPISDEAERMARQGIPVVQLNTGNPALFGFETPDYIVRDLVRGAALSAAYCSSGGIDAARQAIAAYCEGKGIPGVAMRDVYTGNGVSELIQLSLQALLDPGDEVLIPAPDYPLWTAATRLAGGTPVHYLCDEQADWYPDMADLRRKVSARTKAVVVINPNNPTGALYPDALLQDVLQVARENGLLVFSDEIYDRLVMDGQAHTATASLAPDVPVVTFNGLSKSHHICGFRCGWMVLSGPEDMLDSYREGLSVLASLRLCSNVLSQTVIPAALADTTYTHQYLRPGGRLFEQRQTAYDLLNAIPGVSAVMPKAGLYIFPKLDLQRLRINDDERFVYDFLKEKQVLLTHGRSYNWPGADHFRLVYLPRKDQLADVLCRLADFLATYRQY